MTDHGSYKFSKPMDRTPAKYAAKFLTMKRQQPALDYINRKYSSFLGRVVEWFKNIGNKI